jgi:PAS domain S-box-containing protein
MKPLIPFISLFWNKVHTRLFLLVLLVVIPALGVEMLGAWNDLQQNIDNRKLESVRIIKQQAGEFNNLLAETRSTFSDLVRVNDMRSPNNCTQVFTTLRYAYERLAPDATNIGLADRQGNIYCAVNPIQGNRQITDRLDFQNALQTLDMSVGAYTPQVANALPVLSVSYPVLSFNGDIQTIIFATFETHWLEKWQNEGALPSGTTLSLLSPDGQVLWRSLNGQVLKTDGLSAAATRWFAPLQFGQNVMETPDVDGIVRLHTLLPLNLNSQNAAILHLGYPVNELYDLAYQALWWKMGLLALVVFIALAVAWWSSENLFLRPLAGLMEGVRHVQQGNLSVRVSNLKGLGELTELAQSFDRMAESLQQREIDRQRSEARFQTIFESSAVGIGIQSLDRKIIDANPAMLRMFGRTLEEFVGQTPVIATYPEDYPYSTENFEDLVTGKRNSYWQERRYVRKNGEVFWAHVTMSVVKDASGTPLYLVGMVIDIDEQRRVLAELKESEARFRAVFESSAMGVAIVDVDTLLFKINQAARDMTRDSGIERHLNSIYNFVIPEYQESEKELIDDLLTSRRDSYQVEHCYERDGECLKWSHITFSAVKDPNGKVRYLVGMMEDITERRLAQQTLQESEARFRAILDNAAVGVAVMSFDRRILQVNQTACRLTGLSAEEMRSINPSLLAVEEDRYIDQELFAELLEGKRDQYMAEKRYIRKDGSLFWGRVNFSIVRAPDGKPAYTIGMIEDINEEKLSAEKLATQEAQYRHSLEQRVAERTLELNKANELLREKAAQDAVAAERTRLARDLHDAVTQTLFSATLIADVLPDLWIMNRDEGQRRLEELRQLTRGALAEMRTLLVELRPNALVEVPLPTLLRQLTEALTGRSRVNIQLNAEGETKLPADVQVGLYRIAQEALNNVVKHARADQAVLTLRLGKSVRLTVADNGIGFDPSIVTADHLGLKIMRERAESIGARISLYSEPGEGSQVSVVWENKPASSVP